MSYNYLFGTKSERWLTTDVTVNTEIIQIAMNRNNISTEILISILVSLWLLEYNQILAAYFMNDSKEKEKYTIWIFPFRMVRIFYHYFPCLFGMRAYW